jgi:hypothetical protein
MPTSATSPVRPEAELESHLATALAVAFPNISREQLVEQRRSTVRLGAAQWEKSGRAEMLDAFLLRHKTSASAVSRVPM